MLILDTVPPTATLSSKQARAKGIQVALWLVIGLMLACVWGPRLFRSLWVDEAGTFLMAHKGPLAAIQITSHWPGQSILYAVLESFFTWGGTPLRDFTLRLPALAGILLSAWFLYRLAEKAFGKGAGFLAAGLFVFHPSVILLATQARPYSLALAAVSGSFLALHEWIERRELRFLLYFVAASTLIVYLHYFFSIVFLCQALYIGYVFVVERRRQRWPLLLAAYALIGLLITPLLPHMRLLLHEAHTLPFAPTPSINELGEALFPSMFSLGLFLAALLLQFVFPQSFRRPRPASRPLLVLLLTWWLVPPTLFFAASVATPMRVFLPRYIASALPGQTLLLAYAGYSLFQILPARFWVVCGVLLSTPNIWAFLAPHRPGLEEVGPFMRIIQAHSRQNLPPVLYSSPLPESNFYNWKAGLADESYLYAAFVAYPMKNTLLPLPFTLNTDGVKAHIEELIHTQLADTPQVIFVTHTFIGEEAFTEWLIARMQQAGFTADAENPNAYHVLIFSKKVSTVPNTGGRDFKARLSTAKLVNSTPDT